MRPVVGFTALVAIFFNVEGVAVQAMTYRFANLYDESDGFSGFETPSINDLGVVTFAATRDSKTTIVSGDGGPLRSIINVGDQINGTSIVELDITPAINNSGTVVFKARLATEVQGLYTSKLGMISTIADTAGPFRPNLVGDFGVPDINNQGSVLFDAGLKTGGSGTFLSDGSILSKVLDVSTSGSPSINDLGEISYSTSMGGVFLKQGNVLTNLSNGMPGFRSAQSVAINNSGQVAFGFTATSMRRGVALASVGTLSIVADTTGAFTSIGLEPGINNNGDVAFSGSASGNSGLFTSLNLQTHKVIVEGDPLFGSIVESLNFSFYRHGFNNRGQLAFRYWLVNGQSGIAVATPIPEQSAFGLFVVAALVSVPFLRRFATRKGNYGADRQD